MDITKICKRIIVSIIAIPISICVIPLCTGFWIMGWLIEDDWWMEAAKDGVAAWWLPNFYRELWMESKGVSDDY